MQFILRLNNSDFSWNNRYLKRQDLLISNESGPGLSWVHPERQKNIEQIMFGGQNQTILANVKLHLLTWNDAWKKNSDWEFVGSAFLEDGKLGLLLGLFRFVHFDNHRLRRHFRWTGIQFLDFRQALKRKHLLFYVWIISNI